MILQIKVHIFNADNVGKKAAFEGRGLVVPKLKMRKISLAGLIKIQGELNSKRR
jgi:hypothetical protein